MNLTDLWQAILDLQASVGALLRRSGSNGPAPGTPAYNPSWYALTDIYLDPAAGSDSNSGKLGSPLKTMAQVVQRYGSWTPQLPYGQSLTVWVRRVRSMLLRPTIRTQPESRSRARIWTLPRVC